MDLDALVKKMQSNFEDPQQDVAVRVETYLLVMESLVEQDVETLTIPEVMAILGDIAQRIRM